jgi:filamentous hemagglutinin family protein
VMIIESMHPLNGLFRMKKYFLSFVLSFVLITYGFSLPEGTTAVQGEGNAQTVGSEMTITAPDNSIFEHQNFNVAPNETVRFVQPSIESRVLNRVVGAGAKSSIQGNIIANGSVYLVNPAGVVFGSGSSVNVGRLHVVAGSLSNDNFNTGTDTFTDLAGEVRNEGVINATSVSFAGALVVNSGQIYAPGGYVVLAQGDEGNNSSVSLTSSTGTSSVELVDSSGLLSVSVGSETKTASTMIADLGGHAILQTGIIEASRIEMHGRKVQADGSIKGDVVRVVPRESAYQYDTESKIDTSKLYLEPGQETYMREGSSVLVESPTYFIPESRSTVPNVDLLSSSNQIPEVLASGYFSKIGVRSASDMEVRMGVLSTSTSSLSLQANEADFRVYKGDLRMIDSISGTSSSSVLLLAAENQVILEQPTSSYAFYTRLIYGKSLQEYVLESSSKSSTSETSGSGSAFIPLRATTVTMDDLSTALSPSVILPLVRENPDVFNLGAYSDAQLMEAFDYDYFIGNSYFLRSLSTSPTAIFGDDFSVLSTPAIETTTISEVEAAEVVVSEKPSSRFDGVASVVQFSPITMPLLSPMASKLLDDALSDDVENELKKYLKK